MAHQRSASTDRRTASLRERRKHETRLDIADAATHLVVEHGMESTTVEMIAEHAGISTRTFFNYFDTKAEAVLARTIDTFSALPQLLADRPIGESDLVAVREAMCELAAITPADGAHLRAITSSNPAMKAELDRVFDAVGDLLRSCLIARHPGEENAAKPAAVAVAVGLGMLGLAFRDTVVNNPGTAVSPHRLREYFNVLAEMPLMHGPAL